ncbi:UNVERIFIED_CONTAM: hypothetical protein GTU68_001210 [Idotea baltica]|nr:hypothetical protein [Idotea baltica]
MNTEEKEIQTPPDLPASIEGEDSTDKPVQKPEAKVETVQPESGKKGDPPKEKSEKAEKEAPPAPKVPEFIDLNEFQQEPLAKLHALAQEANLRVAGVRSKHQLVFEILQYYGKHGTRLEAEGFLEHHGDNFGFLRWPKLSFAPNADCVHITLNFIKKYDLKPGQRVRCRIRQPRDREKYLSVEEILTVEGKPADEWESGRPFDSLTALFPDERIILEYEGAESPSSRAIDLIAPLGKGQRGLIVAPPRGGKTILLKNIAISIHKNHPEVELIVLLLDERPEEVTDFKETVEAEVFSSTFDESAQRHVQVSDMVLERAKRMVEEGKHVVVLLDSLTRLARAHNSSAQGGGPIGSGGISPKALERSRKFFGAARNVDEGGSLTILATCLIETDSRMDDIIFEEFKGTGNMEITLDREMAESRIWPAIHGLKSGTRKDELLYHPDEYQRVTGLRKQMAQRPAGEAMEALIKNIAITNSNAELLLRGLQ